MNRRLIMLGICAASLCGCRGSEDVNTQEIDPKVREACSGLASASRRSRLEVNKEEAIAIAKALWRKRGVNTKLYEPIVASNKGGLWKVESPSTPRGLLRATVCHKNGQLIGSVELTELHKRTPPPPGGFVPDAVAAEQVAAAVWPALFSRQLDKAEIARKGDWWIVVSGHRLDIRADTSALVSPGVSSPVVPDEKTAVRLAEALAVARYGSGVLKQRPFNVATRDDTWLIESTFPIDRDAGGTAQLGISKADGSVIWMVHGK